MTISHLRGGLGQRLQQDLGETGLVWLSHENIQQWVVKSPTCLFLRILCVDTLSLYHLNTYFLRISWVIL